MKKLNVRITIVFSLCFLFFTMQSTFCFAEKDEIDGDFFLKQEVGARQIAMGGAFVAIADDVNTIYYNPAGLANISGSQISAMYFKNSTETSLRFIGYVQPIKFITRRKSSFEDIEETSESLGVSILTLQGGEEQTDGNSEKGTAEESYLLILGYGRDVFLNGFFGINVKGVYSEFVEEYKRGAVTFDLGALYKLPYRGLSLGFSLQNFGGTLKHSEGNNLLPLTERFGIAYKSNISGIHNVTYALDVLKIKDNKIKENIGVEYSFKEMLMGRIGGRFGDGQGILTTGIGFNFDNMGVDYTWIGGKKWRNQHRISINFKFPINFNEKVEKIIDKRIIEEEFRYSLDLLQRDQLQEGINNLARILRKDPDHKLAKIYLEKTKEKIKKIAKNHYDIGKKHYDSGRWFEAVANWKESLKISGGKETRAKEGLYEINNKLSDIYEMGEDFYNQKKYGEALKKWQEVTEKYPGYLDTKENIIKAQVKIRTMGRQGTQERVIKSIVKEGINYYEKNEYLKAAEKWLQALVLDTQEKEAIYYLNKLKSDFFTRGMNFYRVNKFKEAIDEWGKILNIDPNYEKAKILINKTKEEMYKKVEVMYKKGEEKYKQGDYDQAILLWDEIVHLAPMYNDVREQYIEACLAKGVFYYREHRLKEAAVEWEKIIELDPTNEKALKYLNRVKIKSGYLEELKK